MNILSAHVPLLTWKPVLQHKVVALARPCQIAAPALAVLPGSVLVVGHSVLLPDFSPARGGGLGDLGFMFFGSATFCCTTKLFTCSRIACVVPTE